MMLYVFALCVCVCVCVAIAANGVDDVRTVLDYYKSRGEGNILDTFKEAQAALIQEERQLQQENMARQSSKQRGSGTPISTFSFSRLKRGGGGGGGGGRGGGGGGGWEQHTSPLQAPPEVISFWETWFTKIAIISLHLKYTLFLLLFSLFFWGGEKEGV